MKRKLKWMGVVLFACLGIGLMAGCGDAPQRTFAVDEESLVQRAQAYLLQLRSGHIDPIYQDATAELAGTDKAQLLAAYQSAVQRAGAYQKTLGRTFFQHENGYYNVVVTDEYEKYAMATTVGFDPAGLVSGLYVQFVTVPQQTDAYEEISVSVGAQAQKLSGLLTLPKGVEQPPVVLLVQGSGPSDMDETIGNAPNRPFADLAHGLAERGIATLRYDKRYYRYPPASNKGVTIQQEVLNDVDDAISLLENETRVDTRRIYVLGHSLGGMLVPKIAADHASVKGVISLAGSLRKLEDLVLDQNKLALQAMDWTQEKKDEALSGIQKQVDAIKRLDPNEQDQVILGLPGSYWNSLNAIDGARLARQLHIPMLILQGDADFQVSAQTDYALWQSVLKGRDNATFHLYAGLNHLFMKTSSDAIDATAYDAPGHVESEVMDDISAWVKAQ